jgi:hypothetical protein
MWTIKIGGISDGADVLGIDRHRVALNAIFYAVGPVDFGSHVRPSFPLHRGGRFSTRAIMDGVQSVRLYKDGAAVIELGLSIETQLAGDSELRKAICEVIEGGSNKLIERLERKRIPFNSALFRSLVKQALEEYRLLPSPLPVTRAELLL